MNNQKCVNLRRTKGKKIASIKNQIKRIDSHSYKVKSQSGNGEPNNNKMEHLNNEVRDREKVMRGLKIRDTPIITGYQIFHNYFRPHMALEGKTPSQACGIEIQRKNKWITLIQNAKFRSIDDKRLRGR